MIIENIHKAILSKFGGIPELGVNSFDNEQLAKIMGQIIASYDTDLLNKYQGIVTNCDNRERFYCAALLRCLLIMSSFQSLKEHMEQEFEYDFDECEECEEKEERIEELKSVIKNAIGVLEDEET